MKNAVFSSIRSGEKFFIHAKDKNSGADNMVVAIKVSSSTAKSISGNEYFSMLSTEEVSIYE